MFSSSSVESSLASSVTNTEKDIFDNLNLSKIVSEYLKNYELEYISEEEEERLKSLSETENHIYFSYNDYLFWKNPDTQIFSQDILQTFINFQNSFESFFNDDPEIKLVLSNFDEKSYFFQNILKSTDRESLVKMMQTLTGYLTKLMSLVIDDSEDKIQKVKESLLVFPAKPSSENFICLNGTRERIEQAFSRLFSKNIFDNALKNIISEEIQKIFKDVGPGNQIHLFCCLLDSLIHAPEAIRSRDGQFSSPQSYIELKEISTFIFESRQKLIQNLTRRIDELGDIYYRHIYQKIFDENGALNTGLNLDIIWREIINPFFEHVTPESSGIYSFDYSNLFNSLSEEFSLSELSKLKTKEQFIDELKTHLFKTNKKLFNKDYPDFSQHLIDPQKIFSGDVESGYHLNHFFLENLCKLFDPITQDDSPEITITKKNKIYAGLMSIRLLNKDFSDANPAYLFCFIINFEIFCETSFRDFFYDSDLVLKKEYSEFNDLIQSISTEIDNIEEEFKENIDILHFYSNLILYSPEDFSQVIQEYFRLSGNNFENYQFPNLLQFLVKTNNYDLVKKLIESGSDEFLLLLLQQSNPADSALKLAVKKNNLKMLSMLLDIDMTSDKKIIIKSLLADQDVLYSALEEGKSKAFFLIISKIQEYLIHNPEDQISIDNLLEMKYYEDELSVLSFAVLSQDLRAARELLSIGADINSKDLNGDTPLIHAINSGNIEMVITLVNSRQSLEVSDADGYSPLFFASIKSEEIAEILLNYGAQINTPKNKANNLILALLQDGKIDIVKKFIERGFDINDSYEPDKKTEFIEEILKIDPKYMKFLLEKGLDLTMQVAQGDRTYSLCEYLLDLDEDYDQSNPEFSQNSRETMLENLKIIFLNHPQEFINPSLLKRIGEKKFKENAEYFINLANFIIENQQDEESKRFAQAIIDKINCEQKKDLETQVLIVKNFSNYIEFFSKTVPRGLDEINLLEFKESSDNFSMKLELKADFEDIFLILKFFEAERRKIIYRDKGNFLDNFIRLLEQKEFRGLKVSDNLLRFINKLSPLKKEWIIDQISALKDDQIPPIIKFAESQNPNNLKYFSFFISNYLIDENMLDGLSKFEFFEVLNLIDYKQLRKLETNPIYQDELKPIDLSIVLTDKPNKIKELCCDILNRLEEVKFKRLSEISDNLSLSPRPFLSKKMDYQQTYEYRFM